MLTATIFRAPKVVNVSALPFFQYLFVVSVSLVCFFDRVFCVCAKRMQFVHEESKPTKKRTKERAKYARTGPKLFCITKLSLDAAEL